MIKLVEELLHMKRAYAQADYSEIWKSKYGKS